MPSHKSVFGRKSPASLEPRTPVQLQFEFMETMPPQLSPAAAKAEPEALLKAVGGERPLNRRVAIIRRS
jgi:hypothetical protein